MPLTQLKGAIIVINVNIHVQQMAFKPQVLSVLSLRLKCQGELVNRRKNIHLRATFDLSIHILIFIICHISGDVPALT